MSQIMDENQTLRPGLSNRTNNQLGTGKEIDAFRVLAITESIIECISSTVFTIASLKQTNRSSVIERSIMVRLPTVR